MAGGGNKRLTAEAAEVANWKHPDEGALSGPVYDSYTARKRAVNLYFAGAPDELIKAEAGLSLSQTYKLIKARCMATHPDGEVWGWRGLIPNLRINEHQRKQRIQIDQFGYGSSGALKSLLNQYPELRAKFEKRILTASKTTKLGLVNRSKANHFQWFLKELRLLGLEEQNKWPFNTEKQGYVTICKYIKNLFDQNPAKGALIMGGEDALKKLSTGDGNARPVEHFFQRIEMDAHKIDGRFSVSIPQPTGGYAHKIVHRLWVVVIMEIVSRTVLGYHLSMRKEVSKIDVLRAIKMALTVWKKPKITFGDHAYLANANLPSAVSEEYVGLCWDETSVDGALAETCKTVEKVLENVVGSKLLHPKNSFAVRRNKDDRPFIEAFFRHLGSWGFQQLGNTTGSSPKTKPAKNPEEIALTSQFQYEYAKELLDVLIANYNATPHSSLGGRSPLEYFKFRFLQGGQRRYVDQNSVVHVVSHRKLCTVLGGYNSGRLPHINFQHGRYGSDTLAQRHDLVGKKIWVITHLEDDIRVVMASTQEGQPLGLLTVRPPWSRLPHSLEVRNAIQSLISTGKLRVLAGQDAVEAFLDFYEAQADAKLPVHPAYMEARRVLTEVAASIIPEVADNFQVNSRSSESEHEAVKSSARKRPLPAHRKAAN